MERSADRDHDATAGAGGKLPVAAAAPAASLGARTRVQILRRALCAGMAVAVPFVVLWWSFTVPNLQLTRQAGLIMYLASVAVFGAFSMLWLRTQRRREDALQQSLAETAAETRHVGLLLGLSHAVNHSENFALAGERVLAALTTSWRKTSTSGT